MLAPVPKEPRMPKSTDGGKQFLAADAWFLQLYTDLGEPFPVTDKAIEFHQEHAEVEDPEHPLWALSINTTADAKQYIPKRFLNPGTLEDLWIMCPSVCETYLAQRLFSGEANFKI